MNYFKKTVALFLCASLIPLNNSGYAGATSSVGAQLIAPAGKSRPYIQIPPELGSVENSFSGTSGKTIIYIQDAHDSLEAQENIAKMIGHLVEKEGIQTVFEEGYEGPVPTEDYFGFIQDAKIREKVSYFLLDKLRLGGAEYAHINRRKDFKLIGADNRALHLENIQWYRRSAKEKKKTGKDLQAIAAEIEGLANRFFPKELKEWMKLKARFEKDEINLLDYLKRIMALPLSLRERKASEAILEIASASIGTLLRNDKYPMISLLLASEKSKDPGLIATVQALDAKTLFDEIRRLENDFAFQYLKKDRDRKIFEYHQALELFKRLNDIQMTPPEYESAKETLARLKTRELADFIAKNSGKAVVLSKRWEENIQKAVQFYEMARKRDGAVEKRLQEFLRDSSEKTAVLVFGGFHKEGIQSILRNNGFASVLITPKMTEIDPKHQGYYKRLMSVGHHDFEVPFLPARSGQSPNEPGTPLGRDGLRSEVRQELRMSARAAKPEPVLSLPGGKSEIRAIFDLVSKFPDKDLSLLDRELDFSLFRSEARSDAAAAGFSPYTPEETEDMGEFFELLMPSTALAVLKEKLSEADLPFPGAPTIAIAAEDYSYGELEVFLQGHSAALTDPAKRANFILTFPLKHNLFTETRNGVSSTYLQWGAVQDKDGHWIYGPFKDPLKINTVHFPFPSDEIQRPLKDFQNKINQKHFLRQHEISSAPFISFEKGEKEIEKVKEKILSFALEQGKGLVLKPADGSQGEGVEFFEFADLDFKKAENSELLSKAAASALKLAESGDVLIERRLKSPPYLRSGRKNDWNIRFVPVRGADGQWVTDPKTLAYVRYAPYEKGKPVNVHQGARRADIEEVFADVYPGQKEEVLRRMEEMVKKMLEKLDEEFPSDIPFMGLDVIFEKDSPYLMEINLGAVQGVEILAKHFDHLEGAKHLAAYLLRQANQTVPGSKQGDGRQYAHENESEVIRFNLAEKLYRKASEFNRIGKASEAIDAIRKAVRLRPEVPIFYKGILFDYLLAQNRLAEAEETLASWKVKALYEYSRRAEAYYSLALKYMEMPPAGASAALDKIFHLLEAAFKDSQAGLLAAVEKDAPGLLQDVRAKMNFIDGLLSAKREGLFSISPDPTQQAQWLRLKNLLSELSGVQMTLVDYLDKAGGVSADGLTGAFVKPLDEMRELYLLAKMQKLFIPQHASLFLNALQEMAILASRYSDPAQLKAWAQEHQSAPDAGLRLAAEFLSKHENDEDLFLHFNRFRDDFDRISIELRFLSEALTVRSEARSFDEDGRPEQSIFEEEEKLFKKGDEVKLAGRSYRVEKEIANTILSEIYLVVNLENGREEALKIHSLKKEPEHSRKVSLKLHQQEVEALKAWGREDNPYALAFYDSGVEENYTGITMEFLESKTLLNWVKTKKAGEIAGKWLAVLEAMARLHERHLLHLDFKPDQILVGPKGEIKIIDFGFSRFYHVSTRPGAEKQLRPHAATPYTAPEIFHRELAGPLADVFSLGVSLFHLASGDPRYFNSDLNKLIYFSTQAEFHKEPEEADIARRLPPEWKPYARVMTWAIRANSSLRYASVRDMKEEMEKIVEAEKRKQRQRNDLVEFLSQTLQKFPSASPEMHPAILNAFREVDRAWFVPPDSRSRAYKDEIIPLGEPGSTLSEPSVIAEMFALAGPGLRGRVLEIGSGSGYATALLSHLAREVYGIEFSSNLAVKARAALDDFRIPNVHLLAADGIYGWIENAPYHAILFSNELPFIPLLLSNQLAEGGVMVFPYKGSLRRYVKTNGVVRLDQVVKGRFFVPLKGAGISLSSLSSMASWLAWNASKFVRAEAPSFLKRREIPSSRDGLRSEARGLDPASGLAEKTRIKEELFGQMQLIFEKEPEKETYYLDDIIAVFRKAHAMRPDFERFAVNHSEIPLEFAGRFDGPVAPYLMEISKKTREVSLEVLNPKGDLARAKRILKEFPDEPMTANLVIHSLAEEMEMATGLLKARIREFLKDYLSEDLQRKGKHVPGFVHYLVDHYAGRGYTLVFMERGAQQVRLLTEKLLLSQGKEPEDLIREMPVSAQLAEPYEEAGQYANPALGSEAIRELLRKKNVLEKEKVVFVDIGFSGWLSAPLVKAMQAEHKNAEIFLMTLKGAWDPLLKNGIPVGGYNFVRLGLTPDHFKDDSYFDWENPFNEDIDAAFLLDNTFGKKYEPIYQFQAGEPVLRPTLTPEFHELSNEILFDWAGRVNLFRSEARTEKEDKIAWFREIAKGKRPAVIEAGYYPAIGKDIEVPVEAFNPKVLAGVDPIYANKKNVKVTIGGRTFTLKPAPVKIALKDGTVIEVPKFETAVGKTRVVLYGGDAKVLTPDVLPETQKGYDLFFTSGGPGLKAPAYRKAMETLRPEGVAVVDFVPADFIEDAYRVFDEMQGEISEGEVFFSQGSSRSAPGLYTVWKKTNMPQALPAGKKSETTREIFFDHPAWSQTPGAFEGFLHLALRATDPEIQRRAEEAVLKRIQGDQALLKGVLERMQVNPAIPELLILSRIVLKSFEFYRDKGIPEEYGRLLTSAVRYIDTAPVYKDILENIAKAQAILFGLLNSSDLNKSQRLSRSEVRSLDTAESGLLKKRINLQLLRMKSLAGESDGTAFFTVAQWVIDGIEKLRKETTISEYENFIMSAKENFKASIALRAERVGGDANQRTEMDKLNDRMEGGQTETVLPLPSPEAKKDKPVQTKAKRLEEKKKEERKKPAVPNTEESRQGAKKPPSEAHVGEKPTLIKKTAQGQKRKFEPGLAAEHILDLFRNEPERKRFPTNRELAVRFGVSPATVTHNLKETLKQLKSKMATEEFDEILRKRIEMADLVEREFVLALARFLMEVFKENPSQSEMPSQSLIAERLGVSLETRLAPSYYDGLRELSRMAEAEPDELQSRIKAAIQSKTIKINSAMLNQAADNLIQYFRQGEKDRLPPVEEISRPFGVSLRNNTSEILEIFKKKMKHEKIDSKLRERIERALQRGIGARVNIKKAVDFIIEKFEKEENRKALPLQREIAEAQKTGISQTAVSGQMEAILSEVEKEIAGPFYAKIQERLAGAIRVYRNLPLAMAQSMRAHFEKDPKRLMLPEYPEIVSNLGIPLTTVRRNYPQALIELEQEISKRDFPKLLGQRIRHALEVRSETRRAEYAGMSRHQSKGTLLMKAEELAALSHGEAEELFEMASMNRKEIRFVIYESRSEMREDPAVQAFVKLSNVKVTPLEAEPALRKYGVPQGFDVHLSGEAGRTQLKKDFGNAFRRRLEFVLLRKQPGQIAAAVLFLKNRGVLRGVNKEGDFWLAELEFSAEISRKFLSHLVVAYSA